MMNKEMEESRETLLRKQESFSDDEDVELVGVTGSDKHGYSTAYHRIVLLPPGRKQRRMSIFGLLGAILAIAIIAALYMHKKKPSYIQSPPWYPTPRGGTHQSWADSYDKAASMVNRMTLLDKVNITTGVGWASDLCVGNTGPATSVGFPSLCLQDGPLGIRFADHITAFPAGLTVAATWNRDLMYRRGRAHAKEAKGKGVNVLLGPSMGPLGRMPAAGRNWEGFGVDPVLEAVAASETIKGIQDEGVQATAKHLIAQEQEHYRQPNRWGIPDAISSNVDDRTLHELYLWPFAESVRAGVASVMCSYQQLNNSYSCGNAKLMNGILKDELGFQGWVQSDWLAQRSGVSSALAGLDVTMPGDGLLWADAKSLWGDQLTLAVLNGSVPIERLDDMATRIVAGWYQLGQDKWNNTGPNFSSWTDERMGLIHNSSGGGIIDVVNEFIDVQGSGREAHGKLAREVAIEGTVLVKNVDNMLPLNRHGSSSHTSDKTRVNIGVFGEDAGEGQGPNACKDRGCNQGTLASGWGSGAVEFPYLVTPIKALRGEFDHENVNLTEHLTNDLPSESVTADQDVCIVFINSDSGEGHIKWSNVAGDRPDLSIQKGGDKLVQFVANTCGNGNGKTIVVVHSVGPAIVESWADMDGVKAMILANLPGQESGAALAAVLFGDVDATGRLPYTLGKSLEDYGAGGQVLFSPNSWVPQQDFKEGLLIDYRHFDKYNIEPRYEFGFGLSYTTFEYSKLEIKTLKEKSAYPAPRPDGLNPPSYNSKIPEVKDTLWPEDLHRVKNRIYPYINSAADVKQGRYPYPEGYNTKQPLSQAGGAPGGNPSLFEEHISVSFTIKNNGSRSGKDVPQIYVRFPEKVTNIGDETVDFPVRVLRQFEKIELKAGESKTIEIKLTRKDLSYWDVWAQNWIMPQATFGIDIGRSSRDIVLKGEW